MKTVHKFPFYNTPFIHMPEGAKALTVQLQDGLPVIWAEVETDRPKVPRRFLLVGTGHAMTDEPTAYVGTFQDGGFVGHIFEVLPAPAASPVENSGTYQFLDKIKPGIAPPPPPLVAPDFFPLKAMILDGTSEALRDGWWPKDFKQYVYEQAMEAVFGPKFFEWKNEQRWGGE